MRSLPRARYVFIGADGAITICLARRLGRKRRVTNGLKAAIALIAKVLTAEHASRPTERGSSSKRSFVITAWLE